MNIYEITHREPPALPYLQTNFQKCFVITDRLGDVDRIFKKKYPVNEITNIDFRIDVEVLHE